MQRSFFLNAVAIGASASALLASAVVPSAFAQTQTSSDIGRQPAVYYDLPTTVRVRVGTVRILRPRCDSAYPMDESLPCGTATGGPVGGRGS